MALEKHFKFVLNPGLYTEGEIVPIYVRKDMQRVIEGSAMVIRVEKTGLKFTDGSVQAKEDVAFEMCQEILDRYPRYGIGYDGLNHVLSIFDEEASYRARKEQKNKEKARKRKEVDKIPLPYKYKCNTCGLISAFSKDPDEISCLQCESDDRNYDLEEL
jgi:hypothetical protein